MHVVLRAAISHDRVEVWSAKNGRSSGGKWHVNLGRMTIHLGADLERFVENVLAEDAMHEGIHEGIVHPPFTSTTHCALHCLQELLQTQLLHNQS